MERLKYYRNRRGLSQKGLADLSGVPQPNVSKIETGARGRPQAATLRKLAAALGVQVEDLLGGPEPYWLRGARETTQKLEKEENPADAVVTITAKGLLSSLRRWHGDLTPAQVGDALDLVDRLIAVGERTRQVGVEPEEAQEDRQLVLGTMNG